MLHDGVPPHVRNAAGHWLEGVFGYRSRGGGLSDQLMLKVASAVEIDTRGRRRTELLRTILTACEADDDTYLDVLDAALHMTRGSSAGSLRSILATGRCAWTVADTNRSLVRRVDATAEDQGRRAMSSDETASLELSEAWDMVYGRNPDPSDAWDHAIKAVEAAMIPVVCPSQDQPQLGHVVGALSGQPEQWRLALPGSEGAHDVAALEAMLRLLWPNPDRHGNPEHSRVPTEEEARAVVHLATTLVQWSREGVLQRA